MSMEELAKTILVRLPKIKKKINTVAHIIEGVMLICVTWLVAISPKILIPVDTAIIIVGDVKYVECIYSYCK